MIGDKLQVIDYDFIRSDRLFSAETGDSLIGNRFVIFLIAHRRIVQLLFIFFCSLTSIVNLRAEAVRQPAERHRSLPVASLTTMPQRVEDCAHNPLRRCYQPDD